MQWSDSEAGEDLDGEEADEEEEDLYENMHLFGANLHVGLNIQAGACTCMGMAACLSVPLLAACMHAIAPANNSTTTPPPASTHHASRITMHASPDGVCFACLGRAKH